MRYLMNQKWLSFGDDYSIKTDDGREAFFVDGKVFSWGNKLSMRDDRGEEAAFIAQKLLAWGPTYEIYRNQSLFAVVKKDLFTVFHYTFHIDVPGPDDYTVEGNFLDHEYTFARSGGSVAQVSKRWFSLTDSYGIDIVDGEDDVTILAACVVIDLCCHPDQKR